MPLLKVITPGASSIQGLGYYGAQRYGLAPGGAMDRLSLAEANALTGLPAGAAAIEVGPLPARFAMSGASVRIAVTGAARDVLVDEVPLRLGVTALVRDGQIVTMRGARGGQFSYISIEGGLQQSGNSGEVAVKTRAGADPRSWVLSAGDAIPLRAADASASERQLQLHTRSAAPVRVVLGPQIDYFSEEETARFLAAPWIVSHASNRMAYVLEGGRVALAKGHNIVSDGTVTGNIQIAGNGQPIVILCDRGTIGGYPKIATVISADIGRLAQVPLGGRVQFDAITVLEAQVVARDFAERLANVKPRVESAGSAQGAQPSAAALLASNVAGEVFNPLDGMPESTGPEAAGYRGQP